ncbi:hypothetical protein Goari_026723, partial [Gossypium aridum]|nr:hypothetical protein [Gossypium aridum]
MAPAFPLEYIGPKESERYSFSQLMGKSREYFKGGNRSGFIPGYRHAVETMGESEGIGSSGRINTEMTASEGSCAPKRKCIGLNADSYNNFGVPMQALLLSKMSQSERKNLELRLKMELEQVRLLQKKVASLDSRLDFLSPSRDNRSCSDGKKMPLLNNFNRSGAWNSQVSNSNAYLMKQCEALLNLLMQHNFGWVFNSPVDVVKLNIPDYFTVIKHPMDFGTVKKKITSGQYASPLDFAADVRLTLSNAMTYNPPGNDVHIMAETLSKYFEARWKAIEKKLPITMNVEKQQLSTELESLLGELPENIIDFLKEHSSTECQMGEEEIEIDIDALSDETLFQLRKLLDGYLLGKQKNQAKVEHVKWRYIPKSLCQYLADFLSIAGRDPSTSSYPPVEIEKELNHTNSKCSSSSSSSGESDSDSGTESDAAKASISVRSTK